MSKKRGNSSTSNLGRSIIKSRFAKIGHNHKSFLHTTELNDGYDWGRLNLNSITEQSNLEDFLTTAEMAGTEFIAERMNVVVIDPDKDGGLPGNKELKEVAETQEKYREKLCIPRRPKWDETTTAEELASHERENFLLWRRDLAQLQEEKNIIMTPYEKNLEFWRQLWRVIERSDIIVQIVDARNPLLFYCDDLEKYTKEVDGSKVSIVLVNKADFLTPGQRQHWLDYFSSLGVLVAFWSALRETVAQKKTAKTDEMNDSDDGDDEDEFSGSADDSSDDDDKSDEDSVDDACSDVENNDSVVHESDDVSKHGGDTPTCAAEDVAIDNKIDVLQNGGQSDCIPVDFVGGVDEESGRSLEQFHHCTSELLSVEQLLDVFRNLSQSFHTALDHVTTVGMLGYPNVGKSSTINAIMQAKKVPVSATPGRTKHFQTLYVDDDLMLCDCPGLVFPSFVSTKAELVVNGVLPIDQMREHIPPVSLVCQRIPRPILCRMYGILLPAPGDMEDPLRSPTAYELLQAYSFMRGYMTHKGLPDGPRASRHILKDYVNGKLLFCQPPPGVDVDTYQPTVSCLANVDVSRKPLKTEDQYIDKPLTNIQGNVDQDFFQEKKSTVHCKGVYGMTDYWRQSHRQTELPIIARSGKQTVSDKPWRQKVKRTHKKTEKLRRVYNYLDA